MKARGVGLAHVGRKRTNNEDSWLADDQLGLYVVADGMGGEAGGEVASQTAIEAVASTIRGARELIARAVEEASLGNEVSALVKSAVRNATQAVHDRAKAGEGSPSMGCTLTVFLALGDRGVLAHVGDSRLYVCRGGVLHQLTRDHTFAAELARQGVIEEEAVKSHPYSHVLTQVIGRLDCQIDTVRFALLPGDRALLCSDGLSNYVTDEAWLAGKLQEEDLDGVPEELVQFANRAGGGDNITAVVVGIDAEPTPAQRRAAEAVRGKLEALDTSFLCERMSLARQSLFVSHCELREHPVGGVVVERGSRLAGVGLVVGGSLDVQVDGGVSVGQLVPGDTFGLSALVSPRNARAALVANEDSRTLLLTAAGLQALTRIRPRLGAILLRRVARVLAEGLDGRPQEPTEAPPMFVP